MLLAFSLEADDDVVAQSWARGLGVMLAKREERSFEDGERKLRPLVAPRNADAYVLCSLHGEPGQSPHDKLCRLAMFIAALRDHGAARVTAVVPYLAYARKDRRTQPFDPVGGRYVAQMLEAVGLTRLFVLEPHNVAAFDNAFRCEAHALAAHPAFADVAAELAASGEPLAVASPDPGGVKRAQLWREALEVQLHREVGFAMVDKRRSSGIVSGSHLVAGDVAGANVLLFDDLIASGETMLRAAVALRRAGARRVVACAAHGLFVADAARVLADEQIDQVVVTDSVASFRVPPQSPLRRKLRVVSCVPQLVDAIKTSLASP
ncbi:ribose-phosphate diphosphokinase [Piscinibacter gummiphilus]|uniref:ribose-phosphate diphosphokinase n=1 Tax=Piscinibacter gummiphilus TaxID=946333 RepID=A0ABZ0CQY1_9BURK|nr:ribose-phosphate diphosphokinase [Piscinibacter gummiphilus]WOB07400.1 ribose-phosphate diphosphokinase [Piscinibacter gummiphilus]